MVEKRLSLALENLVSRGELTEADALKVEAEFTKTNTLEVSRRKILAEIGGYLGGLIVSLIIILGQRWHNISKTTFFSLFISLAVLQFIATFAIGKSTAIRSRLAGLLGATASTCTTLAVLSLRIQGNGILTFAIFVGWLFTLASYIWNRSIIGQLSLAAYSIAFGISGITKLLLHIRNYSYVSAFVLGVLGAIWLVLANLQFFDRLLGDAISMAMLLAAGQFIFDGNYRFITYLIYLGIVVAALWLYSQSPEWPLLVGVIAAITIGTGEFVGETLGGSLGATLGLLTSGIVFVCGSVITFKRSKRVLA
jgi:hypothetical protein